MTKLIFLEGISGVGKSTMTKKLCDDLQAIGKTAKAYVEFDYTNPIDFYCVAYCNADEYETLCAKYPQCEKTIRANTVDAGNARLIHYFDEDTPLFEEPLLSAFMEREFCYNPRNPVSFEVYSQAYIFVWENFVNSLGDDMDFFIFDGSLLHHPINDMIRNYGATRDQAFIHIQKLLRILSETEYTIYYLRTADIAAQLRTSYYNRSLQPPNRFEITFWEKRYEYDCFVLNHINANYQVLDVKNQWDNAEKKILREILS